MTAPTTPASTAFRTRLRSSLMCSMSGLRASGLTVLDPRILRPPGGDAGSAGGVICAADSERLLRVRLGRRGAACGWRGAWLLLQVPDLLLQVLQLLLGGVRGGLARHGAGGWRRA